MAIQPNPIALWSSRRVVGRFIGDPLFFRKAERPVRKIDTALDLSWLRCDLASHYSSMVRPSIDPELMIRTLVPRSSR